MDSNKSGYSKRPLWQWIALYAIIGVIAYGAIYFLFLNKQNPYSYSSTQTNQPTQSPMEMPTQSQGQVQTNPSAKTTVSKNAVTIQNYAYSPATLTVKLGDTVTWTNQDSIGHSATADDNSFDTGILSQGQSKTITFNKAGTYTYHCRVHPYMHGTIVVQ